MALKSRLQARYDEAARERLQPLARPSIPAGRRASHRARRFVCVRYRGECVVGAVLSFVRERELLFERWLSEVERLLGRQVDRDAAFKAWTEGYSAAEYAHEVQEDWSKGPWCC